MRITGNGSVGIGTTAPAQKLEVNGNAQIDGASGTNNGDTSLFYTFAYDGLVLQPSTANSAGEVIILPSGTGSQSSLWLLTTSSENDTGYDSLGLGSGNSFSGGPSNTFTLASLVSGNASMAHRILGIKFHSGQICGPHHH
jgi:hypothetical protein